MSDLRSLIAPSHNRCNHFGFTLIEMLGIVVIIGIIAAFTLPNFLSWVTTKYVEDSLLKTEAAIKEAQATAISKSQTCTLSITSSSITATPTDCLPTGPRDFTQTADRNASQVAVAITAQTTPIILRFSPKGSTSSSNILVFSHPDQSQQMRCLAISAGPGILRTGRFTGTNPPVTAEINTTNCHTSP